MASRTLKGWTGNVARAAGFRTTVSFRRLSMRFLPTRGTRRPPT